MADKTYTDMNDLYYAANKAIDDPVSVLEAGIVIDTAQMTWAEWGEYYSNIGKDIAEGFEQLTENPAKSIDKGANELFAAAILSAPLYYVKLPTTPKYTVASAGFKVSRFKPFTVAIDDVIIKVESGDMKRGITHVIKRHSPDYYLREGLIPTAHTSLFLQSDIKYVTGLIKKCNKGNLIAHYAGDNARNNIMEFSIRNSYGFKRTYALVYNKNTGKLVSFFPTSDITSGNLLSKCPGNYQLLIKQRNEYISTQTAAYRKYVID
jgi:hypothetical protein